jgi:hypothetical protein
MATTSTDRESLRSVLAQWKSAVDAHEPKWVAACFTNDAIFQGLHPYSVGRDGVADYYASQPLGMTADFTILETRRLADDLVLGYLSVDFAFTDRPVLTVYLSVIVHHLDDSWKISHYQVSRLASPRSSRWRTNRASPDPDRHPSVGPSRCRCTRIRASRGRRFDRARADVQCRVSRRPIPTEPLCSISRVASSPTTVIIPRTRRCAASPGAARSRVDDPLVHRNRCAGGRRGARLVRRGELGPDHPDPGHGRHDPAHHARSQRPASPESGAATRAGPSPYWTVMSSAASAPGPRTGRGGGVAARRQVASQPPVQTWQKPLIEGGRMVERVYRPTH